MCDMAIIKYKSRVRQEESLGGVLGGPNGSEAVVKIKFALLKKRSSGRTSLSLELDALY